MTAHELLLGGDPDGDGSWELATPWLAVTLPPLLIQLKQWDVLCARVWGSLPFVAFAVLEHGPDVVLAQMDATRAGMEAEEQEVRLLADNPAHHPDEASAWAWVGASPGAGAVAAGLQGGEDGSLAGVGGRGGREWFAMHREFVHMCREELRDKPLILAAWPVGKEACLPAVGALYASISDGSSGLLVKMQAAVHDGEGLDTPAPSVRKFLLRSLRKLKHLKSLGLVQHPEHDLTEAMEKAEAVASAFLEKEALGAGQRDPSFDEWLDRTLSPSSPYVCVCVGGGYPC